MSRSQRAGVTELDNTRTITVRADHVLQTISVGVAEAALRFSLQAPELMVATVATLEGSSIGRMAMRCGLVVDPKLCQ